MRVPTVEPRRRSRFRFRGWIIGIIVILVVLLFSLRGLAGFYTDYLWFDSVGQGTTWSSLLAARVAPALVFTIVFFVIMFVNLVIADRLAPKYRAMGPEDELIARYQQVAGPYTMRIRIGVSLFFALIAGIGVSSQWKQWVLFTHYQSFHRVDPQFHKDIGFYVFQLPFLKFIAEWLFAGSGDRAHRHRGGALPQRRHPLPEPVPAGHAAGQGAPFGHPRGDGAGEDGAVLPGPVRAELLDPGRGPGRERDRREGATSRAQPADLHLDRRRRPVPLEHPPSRLGAADHRGRALGVRVARDRHDLPGGVPAVQGRAERVPGRGEVHRPQHPRDARRLRTRRGADQTLRLHVVGLARRQRSDRRRAEQPDHHQQRAVVGSGHHPVELRDEPEPPDLLPDRRRRRRSLP